LCCPGPDEIRRHGCFEAFKDDWNHFSTTLFPIEWLKHHVRTLKLILTGGKEECHAAACGKYVQINKE
jgi:hypothetical protein